MAHTRQATGRDDGAVLVASLALLAGSAGAALGRLFQGEGPSLLTTGAVAAILVAAALRRRPLALSLVVSSGALAVAAGLLVFPETTWAGLPTAATVEAVARSLGNLGADATREVAPAPPLPSLLMACLIAVWAAATAAHALAVRTRSAVLTVVPPAALVAFADVVAADGTRPGYAAVFLVGAIGVFLGVDIGGLRAWGSVPSGARRRAALLGLPRARWAAVAAVWAIGVAVLAPGVLPGYEREEVLSFEPRGEGGSVTINPIVDIRPNLLRNPPAELFSVRADRGAYWRMLSLDRFTGGVWTASDLRAEQAPLMAGAPVLDGRSLGRRDGLLQRVEIRQLSTIWLPAAFEPRSIDLPADVDGASAIRYDPDAGTLVVANGTDAGYAYDVVSEMPSPRPRRVDRAYAGVPLRNVQARFAGYVALPENMPERIGTIAEQIAGGESTPLRKVLAIQQHLRSFTYSEEAPPGHGADDMVNFLTETRTGYCEQFAGTMAVLVRALGYPARVAVGFLPGQRGPDGWFRVTTAEAHAWPEVFFPGVGWLPFEPTPGRSNPIAEAYVSLPVPGLGLETNSDNYLGRPTTQRREALDRRSAAAPPSPAPAPQEEAPPRPWPVTALVLLAAAAALLGLLGAGKAIVRRLAVARAASPGAAILAAWSVFHASATDLGLGRRAGETLEEYAARLRGQARFSNGHLERLGSLTGRALYSSTPMQARQARDARVAGRDAIRDLRRSSSFARVAAASLRPSRPL